MLLNTFYLSVHGRLFRMETFCLFSFKCVISIYILIVKYKPVDHGGHLLPSGLLILSPWPQTPANFPKRRPSRSFTSLTNINFFFSDQFGFLFTVSMLKAIFSRRYFCPGRQGGFQVGPLRT